MKIRRCSPRKQYALLSGPEFFHYLENERAGIKKGELDSLYPAIQHSIKLKTELVEQDEQDRGVRQFLNLGHTLAHALESVTHYRQYTHGQAVFVGLIFALHLSESYYGYPFPFHPLRPLLSKT